MTTKRNLGGRQHSIGWVPWLCVVGLTIVGCSLILSGSPNGGVAKPAAASVTRSATEGVSNSLRLKPIEEVQVGDVVVARKPGTEQVTRREVVDSFSRQSDHLRVLTVRSADGTTVQDIKATNEHPFYVNGLGWVDAGDLELGQQIEQIDGESATIIASTYEPHPEGMTVYNLTVDGLHTYFVSANGSRAPPLFTHNLTCARAQRLAHLREKFGDPVRRNLAKRVPEPGAIARLTTDASTLKSIRRKLQMRGVGDNPRLRQLWHDSMRWAFYESGSESADQLRRYVRQYASGKRAFTSAELQGAFDVVSSKFRRMARKEGFDYPKHAAVHHWNWNKSVYPEQVFNPDNLFITQRRFHTAVNPDGVNGVHRMLSSGASPTGDPIDPRFIREVGEFDLLEILGL